MSRRTSRLLVLLSLMVVLLALPAFAYAAPVQISGKVLTVGGAPIADDGYVVLYRWNTTEKAWKYWDDDFTDATGVYALVSDDAPAAATWKVRAWDTRDTNLMTGFIGGTFLGSETAAVSPAADVTNLDIAVTTKDNLAPMWLGFNGGTTDIYADSDGYFTNDAYRNVWVWADDEADSPADIRWYGVEGSGIASISYSVNGGDWASIDSSATPNYDMTYWQAPRPIRVSDEGVNTISIKATDRLGNVSIVKSGKVRIDRTAPSTGYDHAGAKGASIMLTPFDALSGANGTYWRYGTTGKFMFGTVVPVPAVAAGTVIQFYSVDEAGNVEVVKQIMAHPAATLTTPKASTTTPKASRTFYVRGKVGGRALAAGTLRVYKLTNGKYKYYGKKAFKESSKGYYSVALKLKKGTYKFRAYYGANTETMSNPPVRSALSVRSVVK